MVLTCRTMARSEGPGEEFCLEMFSGCGGPFTGHPCRATHSSPYPCHASHCAIQAPHCRTLRKFSGGNLPGNCFRNLPSCRHLFSWPCTAREGLTSPLVVGWRLSDHFKSFIRIGWPEVERWARPSPIHTMNSKRHQKPCLPLFDDYHHAPSQKY